jgi:hypothetical protein
MQSPGMARRTGPSRAFQVRDSHRHWLTGHFLLLVAGLGAALAVNRFVTPDHLWAQWVALGWGAAFAVHLLIFARATLGTMGGRR